MFDRSQFLSALATALVLPTAVPPDLGLPDHSPYLPGDAAVTHEIIVHSEYEPAVEVFERVADAAKRLAVADNEGREFRIVGKHVSIRDDLPGRPWQFYVALTR